MSERESYQRRLFAEAIEPYGDAGASGAHTKLSISLPVELTDLVRETARQSGMTVSGVIAASLRRTLGDAEQANLDRALEADAEWNLAWASATLPTTAKLWEELEW
jgi:hypothetical protein